MSHPLLVPVPLWALAMAAASSHITAYYIGKYRGERSRWKRIGSA